MKHWLPVWAMLAAMAVVSCSQGVPKTAHLRTPDEIRRSIGPEGLTSYGTAANHQDYVAYFAPDGRVRMRSGVYTDEGHYRIGSDGKLCITYHTYAAGQEVCRLTYQDGNDVYTVEGEGVVTTISHRRVPGNPEHL